MLFSDLSLILTIMISTLILHQSSEAGIMVGKGQSNCYPQEVAKRFNYLDANEKNQRFPGKNGRTNKRIKMRQKRWYLDRLMLNLAMAIDEYDEKTGLIDTIYSGVIGCGLNKCGKIEGLIPENQTIDNVRCFRNNFRKMISNKLLKFQRGVRIIEKTFGQLICFEETSRFCDRSRRTLLKKLQRDIIKLNLEIETVITNKRLNCSQQPETFASFSPAQPDHETHLMINEWRIIQDSKRFLRDWQENFNKIFKCWKKRQKKKRLKFLKSKSTPKTHLPTHHTKSPKFEKKEESGNHSLQDDRTTKKIVCFRHFPFRQVLGLPESCVH